MDTKPDAAAGGDLRGWPLAASPFHAGEQAAQERAGKRAWSEAAGRRAVRAHMPVQHREFFAQLPCLLLGALDAEGQPWATMLAGVPGFVQAPDPYHLNIGAGLLPADPLDGALQAGSDVGMLGIELQSRRRNRVNGRIEAIGPDGLQVAVSQSFGNCPRYIQLRAVRTVAPAPLPAWRGGRLDEAAQDLLRRADTAFIATYHRAAGEPATGGADVSHRGGKPGFLRVDGDGTVTFPDFNGNAYFNTIGNLLARPQAGLLVPDFEDGTLLHVGGSAEVIWDGPELAGFAGAERLVRIHVERVLRRPGVLPLRWDFQDWSPALAATGSWPAPA
ncbi:pyridoxamine 5'-phosphate oxidase [Cupriavidus sp. USMAA2-4]|uniref:pyridoxamine 5'-phosphate oxidase family protein n=1 Tax=unclassified Cupriavidus TaxID=2640874 RepID=UPI0008A68DEA|nr:MULTISPECIES: pyridoxamine 5'-phosphate oxidase family protein [unclassified Cupriavidus]AOY95707.1 pyridoxamine 5'-phosphate oxidase [Cupriavidus sp. USMAA2-4]AOZ03775.1 pyridoxamine 5'-phosphate oxidase [Cupriavidus sp. USMAHM13]